MRTLFLSRRFPPIHHLFPIMHLICPPKFCITFVFHFSWVLQSFQKNLKPILMQNFRGQMRCIMGDYKRHIRLGYVTDVNWPKRPRKTSLATGTMQKRPFVSDTSPECPDREDLGRCRSWGPFLETPGNFSGPKSNIQIEI